MGRPTLPDTHTGITRGLLEQSRRPTPPLGALHMEQLLQQGSLYVGANVTRPGQRVPYDALLFEADLWCDQAPLPAAGPGITVDVRRTGTAAGGSGSVNDLLCTVGIQGGKTTGNVQGLTTMLYRGDLISYNIVQVGAGFPGANLAIMLNAQTIGPGDPPPPAGV